MVLNRVGVTGASGMVGRHVLSALAVRGIACVATSRRRPEEFPCEGTWRPSNMADVLDTTTLDRLFADVDAVIHLGAAVPSQFDGLPNAEMFNVNVRATFDLGLWAALRKRPLVYLSSASVYAEPEKERITESSPCSVRSMAGFYGATKLLAEQALNSFVPDDLDLIVLRPSSIYGEGMPSSKMVVKFLAQAMRNETLEIKAPADDQINLIHAADVADAALDALAMGARGTFNVAGIHPVSIEDIARTVVDVAGSGAVVVVPANIDRRPRTLFDLDTDKAKTQFGFVANVTLEEGLMRMRDERQQESRNVRQAH